MFCIKCGADLNETDTLCPVCGTPVGAAVFTSHAASEHDFKSASAEKRARAFIVDLIVMLAAYLLLSMFLWGYTIYAMPIVAVLYFTFTVSGRNGATVGMLLRGIKVEKYSDGGTAGVLAAFARFIFTIIFGVTFLFLIRIKDGRSLCDYLTGTITVEK